ncbi:MAG: sulfite exporter TauE/SafE family protein [Methylotenera sp.]|nr:sulfite exporter TauE/SafE family protein [Methylotenera sp.]
MSISLILIFLSLGAFVGLMAGLLGIGGGGILVPLLTTIFLSQHIPTENVVHIALGTSMACIAFTSFASFRAHHANRAVDWSLVKYMAPGIVIGTFSATFIAAMVSSKVLAIFFVCFMAYVSMQMMFKLQVRPSSNTYFTTQSLVHRVELLFAALLIGAISALVSIGGGSLTVPYLGWRGIDIKKAIGTSAAVGFPLSVAGSLGYLLNGWWYAESNTPFVFGFIHLPAVLLISLVSIFTAPIGANLTKKLPVNTIKKIFALLLLSLSLKMLLSLDLLPIVTW